MSRVTDVVLGTGLVTAWVIGLALFPRALEPGRSEQNGVTLNLLVDHGNGRQANDWFRGSPQAAITSTTNGVHVRATESGLQLISRGLAVFPNECYVLLINGRASSGINQVVVMDEDLNALVRGWDFHTTQADSDWRLAFRTGSLRRIAVVFVAELNGEFEFRSAALVRTGQAAECD